MAGGSMGMLVLLSMCCLSSLVAADSSANILRGRSRSLQADSKPAAADVSWAHDWLSPHITGVQNAPRRSLASRFGKTDGVAFCQYYPDGIVKANNLAAAVEGEGVSGWSGVSATKLAAVPTADDVKIVKVENREKDTDGPEMTFQLAPGSYAVTGWAKLDGADTASSYLRTSVRTGGKTIEDGLIIATALAKNDCWVKLSGGFKVKEEANITLHVGGPPAGQSLMVASYAVTTVDDDAWRQAQNERIDQFRKRDVSLVVQGSDGRPLRAFVELDQVVSDFPFGAAISGAYTVDTDYQKWFSKRFTWAVFENEAKWYYNERWQGDANYADADAMVAIAESYNISLRGHNIIWDVPAYVQQWVKDLTPTELRAAVDKRVKDVVQRYKGKFQHWDVNNEMLHGSYYETVLKDPTFASSMFKDVKSLDPNVKNFVNDYNVVEEYSDTAATPEKLLAEIYDIQAQGGQVDGIGIQGHFRSPDGPRIKAELDALATAGIPIWITELDITCADPQEQAERFEVAMREAFSHPAVEGILQWEVARPPCSLWQYQDPAKCTKPCTLCLTDSNYNDRPIGKKYVRLRKEWSTHRNRWTKSSGNFNFRGFFGKYRARVSFGGEQHEVYFDVPKGSDLFSTTVTLNV